MTSAPQRGLPLVTVKGLKLGLSMIDGAVHYALTTVNDISGADLRRPTPCSQWDLGQLLNHLNDSMDALQEGFDTHRVRLPSDGDPPAVDNDARSLVEGFRLRAARLLRSCAGQGVDAPTAIGDLALPSSRMALVGAIEIAVHGWDVAWARETPRPIPPMLALDLLVASPLVITTGGRDPFFTAPLAVPRKADPSDRLIAFLGRRPFPDRPAR